MSEPETRPAHDTPAAPAAPPADGAAMPRQVAIVGRGRVGTALASALRSAGVSVSGPLGRGEAAHGDAVLLCVPDSEIEAAAEAVAGQGGARFVGHVSGATPLGALAPARGVEAFALHPLQTFSSAGGVSLAGTACAIAGSTPAALALARTLAARLGMSAFELDDARRPAYHTAASIASNFLLTLQAAAEAVAAEAGFSPPQARALLAPLVRQTVDNWASHGPQAALTGPVARGDERTVAAQRAAVAAAEPALLPLFDALVERTEALAGGAEARDATAMGVAA
jgi:predicted short-subunit dehydrogenase-like oxidoreductase (DUF2520 family)